LADSTVIFNVTIIIISPFFSPLSFSVSPSCFFVVLHFFTTTKEKNKT